jgi:parvulin-like peptidyl-prolyl isomerase
MSRRRLAAAALLAAMGGVACAGSGSPTDAATVEGKPIPAAEIRRLTDSYLQSQAGKDLAEDSGRHGVEQLVLGFRIKQLYLEHLASSMGVEAESDPRAQAMTVLADEDAYKEAGFRAEDFTSSQRAGHLSHAIAERVFPEVSITEGDLRQAFEERSLTFGRSWKVGGELAILPSADAARALRTRVQSGEPFDAAATALHAAASAQVEITPLSPLPKTIIDAVSGLQQGQISDPIQSGDQWACLKVDHRLDTPQVTFEQVKDDLTRFIGDQKRQQLFSDWFNKKLKTAQVRIDRKFGRWDPTTGTVR